MTHERLSSEGRMETYDWVNITVKYMEHKDEKDMELII